MRKIVLASAAVTSIMLLSACGNSKTEDKAERLQEQALEDADIKIINQNLPEGCTLAYLGEVDTRDATEYRKARVFVTQCGKTATTTTSETNSETSGKSTQEHTTVNVKL
mgnify:CR=1 FL=1